MADRSPPAQCLASLTFAVLCAASPAIACELPTTRNHTVTAIGDARSLILDEGSELRLASLLAPSPFDSPAARNPWPPEVRAKKALGDLVLNKSIAVSLERQARDRYGRLIGQALLDNDNRSTSVKVPLEQQWLQARLISAGHARVALSPEISEDCARSLLRLEAEAESARRGLWNDALYRPKRAEDIAILRKLRSTFHIVEGVIIRIFANKAAVYLNFGNSWRIDFTVRIGRRVMRRAKISKSILSKLTKKPVRIRGWLEKRNGPLIRIWRMEQIELLALQPDGTTRRYQPLRLATDLAPRQSVNKIPRH